MRNFLTSCPLWPSRVARLCRGIMIPRHEVHPPSQEFDIASDLVTDYHIQLPEGSSDLIDLRCGVAEVEFCNIYTCMNLRVAAEKRAARAWRGCSAPGQQALRVPGAQLRV